LESSADLRSVLIAKIRELDLTQREAAKAIGVSQQALSSWVSRDSIPSRTQVPRIAAFLGQPEDEIRRMRVSAAEQDIAVIERIDHLEDAVDALTVRVEEIRRTHHNS
jgi:transcriptional regulator with XRE-family HTH domain